MIQILNQSTQNYTYSICAANRLTEKHTTLHNKATPVFNIWTHFQRQITDFFFFLETHSFGHSMMKLKTFLSSVQLQETIQQDPVGEVASFQQRLTSWQTYVGDHFYPGHQKAL